MIFIDGSNLLRTCNRFYPDVMLEYLKLREILIGDRELVRAYYYGSIPTLETGGTEEIIDKQMRFYRFLQHVGYKVTVLPLRKRGEGRIEKGIDAAIVTDMLSLAYHHAYDVGVLVSGDEDYKNAIRQIMQMGIRIELAFFEGGMAKVYRDIDYPDRPDKIIYLDDITEKIKKTKTNDVIPGRR